MPTPTTSELPKPLSWDEFEDVVWDIYKRKWSDPHAQRYGRTGQAQQGVDVYGRPSELGGAYVGVQCKRYQNLRLKTVEDEIENAEKFEPPLARLIVATTDSRDAPLQKRVRLITQQRESAAEPAKRFPVSVVFWEDLSTELSNPENWDLLVKHYGQWRDVFLTDLERADFDYEPILRAPLRRVFDPLIEDRMKLFGGRRATLERVARFVRNPQGGYLVVTAPPGFGKTALMASLVKATPDVFAYHFFTPLYGDDGLSETFFLRNVVEQMAHWHEYERDLPTQLNDLRALYQQFIAEPLAKTQVLVIDGLDEVTRWELAPYLSRQLPDNLHLIVTVRDVGQDWQAEYRIPADQMEELQLGGLEKGEIETVLRAAGGKAVVLVGKADEIRDKARYMDDEKLGADPLYVRVLAEDAREGLVTVDNIGDQPQGLDKYLDEWMEAALTLADEEGKYGEAAHDLLGTLIVALGPISRADLEALNSSLAESRGLTRVFPKVIHQVRRFAVGDDEDGYALAHPRLRKYMRDHKELDVEAYDQRLLSYCARWREHDSRYALTHYAAHLADAGEEDPDRIEDLYNLISEDWMKAKFAEFYSHQPFSEDVDLAISAAGEEPVNWRQLVGGCLIYATLGSMATNVPPEVLGVLAEFGEAEQQIRARGYADLMRYPAEQSKAYRLMGEALLRRGETARARELLELALAVAKGMDGEYARAEGLSAVAQALGEAGERGLLDQVLAAAMEIGSERNKGHALAGIAQALAHVGGKDALELALETAKSIESRVHLVEALGEVVQALSREADQAALDQALATAEAIEDEYWRAQALSVVAPAVAQVGNIEAVRRALADAEDIKGEEARAKALSGVAQALAHLEDKEALLKALADVKEIKHVVARGLALAATAHTPALVGEKDAAALAARQAMAGVEALWWEPDEVKALSQMALALAEAGERETAARAAQQALEAAETIAIKDKLLGAEALSQATYALAQAGETSLAAQSARKALAAADETWPEGARVQALSGLTGVLAQTGDREALRLALETAKTIQEHDHKVEALSDVALALARTGDEAALQQALEAAQEIGPGQSRAKALGAVAQAMALADMPEDAVQVAQKALTAAEATGGGEDKAKTLSAIAQALARVGDEESLRRGLEAAEAIARGRCKAETFGAAIRALAQAGERAVAARATQLSLTAVKSAFTPDEPELVSVAALALVRAGERDRAAQLVRQALAATERIHYSPLEVEALNAVAQVLAEAGDAKSLQIALTIAKNIDGDYWKAQALSGVAAALGEVGDREALRQALGAARALEDEECRADALSAVAKALALVGDTEALRQALAAAKALSDWSRASKAGALSAVSEALAKVGERESAAEAAQHALVTALSEDHEYHKGQVLGSVANALAQVGDVEGLRRALAAVEKLESGFDQVPALCGVVKALACVGHREALLQALAVAREISDHKSRSEALSGVARALPTVGEVEAAAKAAQQALAAAEEIRSDHLRALALSGVAQALAEMEQPARALAVFAQAFRAARLVRRDSVFSVLEHAGPTLAGIEHGLILGHVYDQVMEVESWWGV